MFWFVFAIVLVSRIAIEKTPEQAALYGIALAASVWIYLVRTHPGYLLGIILLAIVWFCAHRLVLDCTLIDDDDDASGEGLLQKARTMPAKTKTTKKKKGAKISAPGVWVVYFSLAALPLFGIGQLLLPTGAADSRRRGFMLLVMYMIAVLGLLMATSFLGLRRYLRQRYLKMPPAIAWGWLKTGGALALFILIGALFLPRPGALAAWASLRAQVDYRLQQASQFAARANPHGTGEGRAGEDSGKGKEEKGDDGDSGKKADASPQEEHGGKKMQGKGPPGQTPSPSVPPLSSPARMYQWLKTLMLAVAAALAGFWIFRCRFLLWQIACSAWAAILNFFRKLLDLMPARTPVRPQALEVPQARPRPLSQFKNPFHAGKDYSRPPLEIVLYTYEALRAWALEKQMELHPEQTAREFCESISGQVPEIAGPLERLSYLYAHAAYAERLPASCDLEPLRELWQRMTLTTS
jgi:hypothetical protein